MEAVSDENVVKRGDAFGNETMRYPSTSLFVCSRVPRLRRRRKSGQYPPSTRLPDNKVNLNSTPYLRRLVQWIRTWKQA